MSGSGIKDAVRGVCPLFSPDDRYLGYLLLTNYPATPNPAHDAIQLLKLTLLDHEPSPSS